MKKSWLSALLLALAATSPAPAQEEAASKVDTVLDRLEKRLLDHEADGLTFGEKNAPPPSLDANDGPTETMKFQKKTKIGASTAELEGLKQIGGQIAELEQAVDRYASEVQKTKQGILDEAHTDNFITIEARLADTDVAAITSLTVKIDGYGVYELKETGGIWMPSAQVPLYAGPLKPGNHRVDLEARIALKPKKALPMNGDVYRFVNKTFDVVVPGGSRTAKYLINIVPPAKLDGVADATLKEAS